MEWEKEITFVPAEIITLTDIEELMDDEEKPKHNHGGWINCTPDCPAHPNTIDPDYWTTPRKPKKDNKIKNKRSPHSAPWGVSDFEESNVEQENPVTVRYRPGAYISQTLPPYALPPRASTLDGLRRSIEELALPHVGTPFYDVHIQEVPASTGLLRVTAKVPLDKSNTMTSLGNTPTEILEAVLHEILPAGMDAVIQILITSSTYNNEELGVHI